MDLNPFEDVDFYCDAETKLKVGLLADQVARADLEACEFAINSSLLPDPALLNRVVAVAREWGKVDVLTWAVYEVFEDSEGSVPETVYEAVLCATTAIALGGCISEDDKAALSLAWSFAGLAQ
jgi:hypothetical protein